MKPIKYRALRRKAKGIVNYRQMAEARRRSRLRWQHGKLDRIQRSLADPLYRVAYHEAGHYWVRSKLEHQASLRIALSKNSAGEWTGITSRINKTVGADDPDHVGQISIAGAVAETQSADDAYMLLKGHPHLKESDYIWFQKSHGLLRRKLDYISESDYFDRQYRKVSRILSTAGRIQMDQIARKAIIAHDLSFSLQ